MFGGGAPRGQPTSLPIMSDVTPEMSAEVRAFLSEGRRTGILAWTASDGRALAAPVWFVVNGPVLEFNTGSTTAKGRALVRDPRVTICVDTTSPTYAFVQVQGVAEISEDPAELLRSATEIGGRYMGADRAEEFGRRNGVPGELLVRLRPTKIISHMDMTA
jgi:PPOX class probable F420-dependent enzyme